MLKFLRKYNQYILVVGGILLMIAFLVPGALDQCARDPSVVSAFSIDGRTVSQAEAGLADRQYNALSELLGRGTLASFGVTEGAFQWTLLAELANRAGYIAGPREGEEFLADLVPELARRSVRAEYARLYGAAADQVMNSPTFAPTVSQEIQATADFLSRSFEAGLPRIAGRASLTEDQLYHGLAVLKGIIRLQSSYVRAARVSTPRVLHEAKRRLEAAQIDYVFISADTSADAVEDPTEAQLADHYSIFKSVRPGEGEFGIGYLFPPRIKLEWIVLDRAAIAAKVGIEESKVERRLVELMRTSPDAPQLPPVLDRFVYDQTGFAALKPEEQTEANYRRLFRERFAELAARFRDDGYVPEDLRDAVAAELREADVGRVIAAAEQTINTAVTTATISLDPLDDSRFKRLPPDWPAKRPDFHRIAAAIVQSVERATRTDSSRDGSGIRIDPPRVDSREGQWLTQAELAELPGIGPSFLQGDAARLPFPAYALSAYELDPARAIVQVGVPVSRPTADADGNVYFFTVLDARGESAPDSLDEIRALVAKDWKRLQAFHTLARDAEAFRLQAMTDGLDSLLPAPPPTDPAQPQPQPRRAKFANVNRTQLGPADPLIDTDVFRERVVSAASEIDPLIPIEAVELQRRVLAVAIPQSLGLAVVSIRKYTPLTEETFRGQQARIAGELQADEVRGSETSPFSLESLKRRLNVKEPLRPGSTSSESSG